MKIAVCALLFNSDGDLLSVSRRGRPTDLNLPGGKVDEGESPEHAVTREVFEETGLQVLPLYLVYRGVCEGGDHDFDTYCFLVEGSGEPQQMEPGVEPHWISWDRLCSEGNSFHKFNRKIRDQWVSGGRPGSFTFHSAVERFAPDIDNRPTVLLPPYYRIAERLLYVLFPDQSKEELTLEFEKILVAFAEFSKPKQTPSSFPTNPPVAMIDKWIPVEPQMPRKWEEWPVSLDIDWGDLEPEDDSE